MRIKKDIPEELRTSLRPCPVSFRAAENLLRRARKDLTSARAVWSIDSETAYTLLYDCMLHVGLGELPRNSLTWFPRRSEANIPRESLIFETTSMVRKALQEALADLKEGRTVSLREYLRGKRSE